MKIDSFELIKFQDLDLQNLQKVLNWRNHPEIKKWMYNQDDITLEEHLDFIKNLQKNDITGYFLVRDAEENDIGVIYFININYSEKECECGLYKNPFWQQRAGGSLLYLIIKYAFNTLKLDKVKLEVFSNNERAKYLYKKYNFQELGKKVVNSHEVICMELKNDNRQF